MIDHITQFKYKSNLKKIIFPEIIGIMVCIVAAIYIALHFDKLDTNLLKGMGILTIVLSVLLPVINLIILLQFNNIDDLNKTSSETLKGFVTQKVRFNKLP